MNLLKKYFSFSKEKRNLVNVAVVFCASVLWSAIKMVLGILENSKFLVASSFFTLSLAFSKFFCLIGITKHQKQYVRTVHVSSSVLIVLGGIFYGLYNVRLVYGEQCAQYGLIPSITIAAVSFFLFIKSVVFLFKDKKADDYHRNLRILAFISGCVDIVLTQMSILAVEMPDMDPVYNSYIALGVSVLAVVLGVYCLVAPAVVRKQNAKE